MSNIFTTNPIKINIISPSNEIKQSIIFFNNISDDIVKILRDIENKYNSKLNFELNFIKKKNILKLKKFFGPDWTRKLGLNKKKISGGNLFNFDKNIQIKKNNNLETNIEDNLETNIEDNIEDNLEDNLETNIEDDNLFESDSEIDDININEILDLEKTVTVSNNEISKNKNKIDLDSNLSIRYIFDVSIYPEDNVLDFKKKIYSAIGIPIYRQHLWYKFRDITFNLKYTVILNNNVIPVDINNILLKNNLKVINNIPIDINFYNNNENLKIKALDTFNLMSQFYYKFNIYEYNLLDLQNFIDPSDNNLNITDNYQIELIYYGFVIIYWPMVTYDIFF